MAKLRNAITCYREATGLSRNECIAQLLQEDVIRPHGNTTNGLLAYEKEGASSLINKYLAQEKGIDAYSLKIEVAKCDHVTSPNQKIYDHLYNNLEYAKINRIKKCDIYNVLTEYKLITKTEKTVPALCINGYPTYEITRNDVDLWADNIILNSPLIAAIFAYRSGSILPEWVRHTLPSD